MNIWLRVPQGKREKQFFLTVLLAINTAKSILLETQAQDITHYAASLRQAVQHFQRNYTWCPQL